jgi:hypothetical protein
MKKTKNDDEEKEREAPTRTFRSSHVQHVSTSAMVLGFLFRFYFS